MCGGGVVSPLVAFSLYLLGKTSVPIYDVCMYVNITLHYFLLLLLFFYKSSCLYKTHVYIAMVLI